MVGYLTLLLACQLAGTALQDALQLPVPGAVIGMAILFVGLLLWGEVPAGLQDLGKGLLDNLSLLFVPAGVGAMQQLSLIGDSWLAILVSLVGSTLATIAVTGLVMQWLAPRGAAGPHP